MQDLEELLALQESVGYYKKMMRKGPSAVDFEPMLAFAQYQLAEFYLEREMYPEAVDVLIECLYKFKVGNEAEKALNDVFEKLGEDHELVKDARRRMVGINI